METPVAPLAGEGLLGVWGVRQVIIKDTVLLSLPVESSTAQC
jgi:hypothetical protein